MARRLVDPPYLAFPLRVDAAGPQLASRSEHIRGQIEQVLFTLPGERVFRPEFGAGVKTLVFEPNDSPMWQVTRRRLLASLAEALQGEVDPRSLEVEVAGEDASLQIRISYTLAAIGHRDSQQFDLGGA
ncbi:MAG TPA: GPW/gp25 family protein [Ideonella sp.]|uniref:GPW/gp25 family protein n=1 Tax=Ideonella sp. TaxID=1929293 RepID=UPI002D0EDDA2|nr:GPW/gp25 family protein [Ideonella sp.]HSI51434.1 GPW/gp25 family protein [Ideonella sp.]